MPNPQVSLATATAHFDRWLQADRKAAQIYDLLELYRQDKVFVRQDGGYSSTGGRLLTEWALAGVVLSENGRNADADGRLWVRITANGPNWDVILYKAKTAQAGDKVAEALNVAAGATATLVAANSSGVTGTVKLAAAMNAVAADTYAIQVYVGWSYMDRHVFDGTHQEDSEIRAAHVAVNLAIQRALEGALAALNRLNEDAPHRKQMGRIYKIPHDLGFLDKRTENEADAISVLVDGTFERLRQAWEGNTTVLKVNPTTLAAGSVTYEASNIGLFTVTIGAIGPNLEPGLVQIICTEDELPDVRFKITFTPDDGTGPITGRNLATIGKVWDDPSIPIQLTIRPTYTKTGTDANIAPVADIASIEGLASDTSDDGQLYWTVISSGASWIYKFYSDSNRTKLVAQSPAVAANTPFTATGRYGVSVSWKSGSGPTNNGQGTVDANPAKKGTSTHAPDGAYFSVTRSAKGRIQDRAREFHDWKLHQGAGPTFADTLGDKNAQLLDGGQ